MVLDAQLRLHEIFKTPCEGIIIEISPFPMMFPTLPVLVELGEAGGAHPSPQPPSPPDWRSVTHCTCISPETPLHAT